jgi:beta-lactamase class D
MDPVAEITKLREMPRAVLRGKTGTAGDAARDIATLGWFVGGWSMVRRRTSLR